MSPTKGLLLLSCEHSDLERERPQSQGIWEIPHLFRARRFESVSTRQLHGDPVAEDVHANESASTTNNSTMTSNPDKENRSDNYEGEHVVTTSVRSVYSDEQLITPR